MYPSMKLSISYQLTLTLGINHLPVISSIMEYKILMIMIHAAENVNCIFSLKSSLLLAPVYVRLNESIR